jgi:hypothetical protein
MGSVTSSWHKDMGTAYQDPIKTGPIGINVLAAQRSPAYAEPA